MTQSPEPCIGTSKDASYPLHSITDVHDKTAREGFAMTDTHASRMRADRQIPFSLTVTCNLSLLFTG